MTDLWELKLYSKHYRQKGFILEWMFYQNPQSELFKVWMAFRCVNRDLWELQLYFKYYRQIVFNLVWIFKCVLLKSTEQNLQSMNGFWAVPAEVEGRPPQMFFRKIQGWQNWGHTPSNFDRSIWQVMPTTFLLTTSDFQALCLLPFLSGKICQKE